jgi:hypothetical protein
VPELDLLDIRPKVWLLAAKCIGFFKALFGVHP